MALALRPLQVLVGCKLEAINRDVILVTMMALATHSLSSFRRAEEQPSDWPIRCRSWSCSGLQIGGGP
eukprot:2779025-Rhodomonas_salina.3